MKRARETQDLFTGLVNLVTALNTRPTPLVKDTIAIPIKWLALREKAKQTSAEKEFLVKWCVIHHQFEQEELPLDILRGVVGPLLIGLITVLSMQGVVVRLYEPVVLVAMRWRGKEGLSFFYNNQRYTIRKDRHDYLELLVHCHPESEGGYIYTSMMEKCLLMRLDTQCDMALAKAHLDEMERHDEAI